jgi:hypothetical protein
MGLRWGCGWRERPGRSANPTTWSAQRTGSGKHVDWQFTTADARVKLKRLYPVIER